MNKIIIFILFLLFVSPVFAEKETVHNKVIERKFIYNYLTSRYEIKNKYYFLDFIGRKCEVNKEQFNKINLYEFYYCKRWK